MSSTFGTVQDIATGKGQAPGELPILLKLDDRTSWVFLVGDLPATASLEVGDRVEIAPALTEVFERINPSRIARVEKPQRVEITATISRIAYRGRDGWIALSINAEGYVSTSGKVPGTETLERGMRCRFSGIATTYRGRPALELTSVSRLERDLHDPFMVEARRVFAGFTPRHEQKLRDALGDNWPVKLAADSALIERPVFARWNAETRQSVVKVALKLAVMTTLRQDLLTVGLKDKAIDEIVSSLGSDKALAQQGMDAAHLILKGHMTFAQAEDANRLNNFFRASVDRRLAAIWGETLTALDDGSSAVTVSDMRHRLATQYAFTNGEINGTLDELSGVTPVGGALPSIALPGVVECEWDLLRMVERRRGTLALPGSIGAINAKFQGMQRNAIEMILTHKISAVTGGPGTGKTTICAEIVVQLGDVLGVALAARAARNLKDRSGAPAMTIHRFLRLGLGKGEKNPTIRPYAALIVDEASMIGTKQLRQILRAAEKAGVKRVVLIGDADQLSPIEWGRPFADLIAGGALPIIQLTENRRTDAKGGIARLGDDMRVGRSPDYKKTAYKDVSLINVADADVISRQVKNEYLRLVKAGGNFSDIAVLSPYRDPKFMLSSESLNKVIRLSLGMTVDRATVGEIVIATKNDYDNNAINGVRGSVVRSDKRGLAIQFEGTNALAYYQAAELGDDGLPEGVAWGYAYSVHKAQGSEFRHVIVVVSEDMARLFGKPALYTAVTRARETLAIIGDLAAIPKILATPDRRTTVLGTMFAKRAAPPPLAHALSFDDFDTRFASLAEAVEDPEHDEAMAMDRC